MHREALVLALRRALLPVCLQRRRDPLLAMLVCSLGAGAAGCKALGSTLKLAVYGYIYTVDVAFPYKQLSTYGCGPSVDQGSSYLYCVSICGIERPPWLLSV